MRFIASILGLTVAVAALAYSSFFVNPAYAQECTLKSEVLEIFARDKTEFRDLPAEEMEYFLANVAPNFVNIDPSVKVTSVIIATLNGAIVFGMEIDGCLTPPILMAPAAEESPAVDPSMFGPLKSPKAGVQS